jgi:hypothetical protein
MQVSADTILRIVRSEAVPEFRFHVFSGWMIGPGGAGNDTGLCSSTWRRTTSWICCPIAR